MNPDEQNPERVRGFPVEIDVEEGEHDAGENIFGDDDSGYVPTTPPNQIRDSIGNKDRRGLEMWLRGKLHQVQVIRTIRVIRMVRIRMISLGEHPSFQHESRAHCPYDRECEACAQARGRTPARRRKQKAEESGQTGTGCRLHFHCWAALETFGHAYDPYRYAGNCRSDWNRENDVKSLKTFRSRAQMTTFLMMTLILPILHIDHASHR